MFAKWRPFFRLQDTLMSNSSLHIAGKMLTHQQYFTNGNIMSLLHIIIEASNVDDFA